MVKRLCLSLLTGTVLTCGTFLNIPHAAGAASFNPSDYFSYTYSITLSKQYVQSGEIFYASISGTASCIQDALVQPTEAFISGRVIAEHLETGIKVALNSGYSATIAPVSGNQRRSVNSVQELPLYIPWDSPAGQYILTGELTEARFKSGLWFDATGSFPANAGYGHCLLPYSPSRSRRLPSAR